MVNASSKLKMWATKNYRAWKASILIIGLVISNSLAEFAVIGNIINSVAGSFRISAVFVNVMGGTTSFMAIAGAVIADAYISRYFVVLASTTLFIYGLLGFGLVTLEIIPGWYGIQWIALAFMAAGQGGQEHTLRKFGADQFAEHMEDKDKAIHHSRVWWYMGTFFGATAGLVLSFFFSNSSSGFHQKIYHLSPPITMLVAFYVAAMGTLFYYRATPLGSPFLSILRVLVATARKIRLDYPTNESKIHGRVNPSGMAASAENQSISGVDAAQTPTSMTREGSVRLRSASLKKNQVQQQNENMKRKEHVPPLVEQCHDIEENALLSPNDSEASVHPSPPVELHSAKNDVDKEWLHHTNRLRWLDKAAIIDEAETAQVSKWRLCTQTEVEETKCLLSLFPIWATFLMYGMVLSLGKTFFIAQANTLNREFNHRFQIPITLLLAVSGLSKLVVTHACLPLLNWFTGLRSGVYPRIRIGVGFLLSTLCCLIASRVEIRRSKVAKKTGLESWDDGINEMSIFWLVPQFCVLGAMDGLVEEGIEDFFVDQAPTEQLQGCKPAFCDSVKGMGSMLGAVMFWATMTIRPDWLADDINKNHVDRYYFAFFVLGLINLFVYGLVARRYPCKGYRNQHQSESGKGSVKRPVKCLEAIWELLS